MTEIFPPTVRLNTRPSWLSVMNLAAGIQVAAVLIGLIVWVTHKGDTADNVAIAAVAVNTRLDHIADRVDAIAASLPVMQEKVISLERQVTDGRGQYTTLDTRLRAIETNEYANHVDASKALGRKP